jgi:hypothetical protein
MMGKAGSVGAPSRTRGPVHRMASTAISGPWKHKTEMEMMLATATATKKFPER